MSVLYLTQDLFFSTRVVEAGKQLGIEVAVVSGWEQFLERLAEPVAAVIVDLEHRSADPAAISRVLDATSPRPRSMAYGPHVKENLLHAAQAAGFDAVLSRGQFDKQMGSLLRSAVARS